MIQQYGGRREKVDAAERRRRMLAAAHLLNKLRGLADDAGEPLAGRDEDAFWQFVALLPAEDQSSVIN